LGQFGELFGGGGIEVEAAFFVLDAIDEIVGSGAGVLADDAEGAVGEGDILEQGWGIRELAIMVDVALAAACGVVEEEGFSAFGAGEGEVMGLDGVRLVVADAEGEAGGMERADDDD
jgi:hypothetical protein